MKAIISATITLLFSTCVNAQIIFEGKLEHVNTITNEMMSLKKHSETFSALLDEVSKFYDEQSKPKLPLRLFIISRPRGQAFGKKTSELRMTRRYPKKPVNPKEELSIRWDPAMEVTTIVKAKGYVLNLAIMDLLPSVQFAQTTGKPMFIDGKYPTGEPSWAISRESFLAHEIKECFEGLKNGFDFERDHRIAIQFENKIRKDLGQPGERLYRKGGDLESVRIKQRHVLGYDLQVKVGDAIHSHFIEHDDEAVWVKSHYIANEKR